jgi:glucose-6-phosphate 1-dehydrogenase
MFFRVDHVLGMPAIQNLLWLRFANLAWEAVWNSTYIERVDILWEETLGLEGRAGYFDAAGALKDVMQNHMLQVLSFVAMEPPAGLDADELRDRKVEVLRAVRPLTPEAVAAGTRRARYTAVCASRRESARRPSQGRGHPLPSRGARRLRGRRRPFRAVDRH